MSVYRVSISKFAAKQLKKLPKEILEHIRYWQRAVELEGLLEVRKLSGYHDEPLKGDRKGQRSIRLNRAWRLIYIEDVVAGEPVIEVLVIEVNKHEY